MPSPEENPRLVCRCLGVSSVRILAAVAEGGLRTVSEVTKAVRAGGGCGTCHPEIEEILADVAGEPVAPALRLENRLVNQSETLSRVEGTIDSRIRPALATRGISVVDFRVEGLTVRVSLEGSVDEDALRTLRDDLRRFVCRDFEVVQDEAPDEASPAALRSGC
jgi:NifU-like protein